MKDDLNLLANVRHPIFFVNGRLPPSFLSMEAELNVFINKALASPEIGTAQPEIVLLSLTSSCIVIFVALFVVQNKNLYRFSSMHLPYNILYSLQ